MARRAEAPLDTGQYGEARVRNGGIRDITKIV